MIQKFASEEKQEEDSEIHRQIRKIVHNPPDTADDEEFTLQEATYPIQSLGNKKAPGEDGIPNEF